MHVFGVMCISAMGSAHTVTLSEVGQGARRVGRTGWGLGRSLGAHQYSGEGSGNRDFGVYPRDPKDKYVQ